MTGLLLMVLMGLSAFAVDVGNWYLVGQQEQRAADAGAMAGVTSLPGNLAGANALAAAYSKANGFEHLPAAAKNPTTVTSAIDGKNTRLRVTVSRTVRNFFGSLLGVANTTISRTAVADYTGPVPLASPCNEFGNDPDPGSPTSNKSTNCANVGNFWANVGSPKATKVSGDAHQSNVCTTANDGCPGSVNTDYDANGYIYVVTVTAPVTNLTIQAFDPSQIIVGDTCPSNTNTNNSQLEEAAGIGSGAPLGSADASVRYVTGAGAWCTGDTIINGTSGLIKTEFTIRQTGGNAWDPTNWPTLSTANCGGATNPRTFNGFNTRLRDALDSNRSPIAEVRETFRRWVTLCTISGTVQPGTYAIQVKTNGLTPPTNPSDLLGGHNRFALRAYGTGTWKDLVTVAAFNKMAMYANTPNGTSRFFLAKVPSGAKGQTFNIRLFDVGDGATAGSSTIKVLQPSENGVGATFAGCTGTGVVNGSLGASCQIAVSSAYNGKWQKIAVPIPATYTCNDAALTGCWTRLEFFYGSGSSPADTTSWAASIDGDPVRLVE